jgi:hypothetical protein
MFDPAQRFKTFVVAALVAISLAVGVDLNNVANQQHRQDTLITRVEAEARLQGQLAQKIATITGHTNAYGVKLAFTFCHAINTKLPIRVRLPCHILASLLEAAQSPIPSEEGISK